MELPPSTRRFIPLRFGLKYDPVPALALEYETVVEDENCMGASTTDILEIELSKVVPKTFDMEGVVTTLQSDYAEFLGPELVSTKQVERLVALLLKGGQMNLPPQYKQDSTQNTLMQSSGVLNLAGMSTGMSTPPKPQEGGNSSGSPTPEASPCPQPPSPNGSWGVETDRGGKSEGVLDRAAKIVKEPRFEKFNKHDGGKGQLNSTRTQKVDLGNLEDSIENKKGDNRHRDCYLPQKENDDSYEGYSSSKGIAEESTHGAGIKEDDSISTTNSSGDKEDNSKGPAGPSTNINISSPSSPPHPRFEGGAMSPPRPSMGNPDLPLPPLSGRPRGLLGDLPPLVGRGLTSLGGSNGTSLSLPPNPPTPTTSAQVRGIPNNAKPYSISPVNSPPVLKDTSAVLNGTVSRKESTPGFAVNTVNTVEQQVPSGDVTASSLNSNQHKQQEEVDELEKGSAHHEGGQTLLRGGMIDPSVIDIHEDSVDEDISFEQESDLEEGIDNDYFS